MRTDPRRAQRVTISVAISSRFGVTATLRSTAAPQARSSSRQ
jgi:hypothetical protein